MHSGNSAWGLSLVLTAVEGTLRPASSDAYFSHRSSLMRRIILLVLLISSAASLHAQQKLSAHWEELTAADFTHEFPPYSVTVMRFGK